MHLKKMGEVPTISAGRPTQERSWLNRGQCLSVSALMNKMTDTQSTANSDRKMLFQVVQHNCFDMPRIKGLNQATGDMAKAQESKEWERERESGKGKGKTEGRGRGRGRGKGVK